MNLKLFNIFSSIQDNRREITKFYELNDILLMAVIAVLCGADSWNDIEEYCIAKEQWLTKLLDLKHGIPSHDTFNRVISGIDHKEFERCFSLWATGLMQQSGNKEIINLDGKTLRGAKVKGKSMIHTVNAWACRNNIALGQLKTNEKSNEITAIPELLDLLFLEESIVTIDAMGCQKDIAKKIIEKEADYVLAVKDNQSTLLEQIKDEFNFGKNADVFEDIDLGHGRIETRKCSVLTDFQFIEPNNGWENLQSVIKIESVREFKNSDKPTEKAERFYIASLNAGAEDFNQIIRSHWSVENKLHWSLDVTFDEDHDRKRAGNASQNFSILNKIVLNLLKNEKTLKVGIKGKRLKAGWDNNYLKKVINF